MFSLAGDHYKSQEKLETMLMQNLGGGKQRVLWYFPEWPIDKQDNLAGATVLAVDLIQKRRGNKVQLFVKVILQGRPFFPVDTFPCDLGSTVNLKNDGPILSLLFQS